MSGKLILVGTPIGNLNDFSPRAVEALTNADFIAAEDTRVTLKLLNHFEIKKPMISYFEHNKRQRGEEIASRLEAGENCALVTDAGMPAISDPGADLVAVCAQRNITVEVVPGPCAAISALALSGLDTGRFCFEGFLSVTKKSRFEHLEGLKYEKRTMIFYEAPHKLRSTLNDMYKVFGDRRISLVREMTKIHEEVVRTTFEKAVEYYSENTPRGEFVLVIEGSSEDAPIADNEDIEQVSGEELVARYIEQGMTRPEAVKRAAKETGLKRSDLYKRTTGDPSKPE